jgi:transcriptional regulator with XRE-family HTH domain
MLQIRTSGGVPMEIAPEKYGKKYDRAICAERLKALREEKGKTQEEVASHLLVSRTAVVKMENAQQDIKPDYLYTLAQYYGTTTDYILGLTAVRRAGDTLPACDELGLSDDATVKLQTLNGKRSYNRVISRLIEHDWFEDFVRKIRDAILYTVPTFQRPEGTASPDLTSSAKKAGYELIPAVTYKDYNFFLASEILKIMISNISDSFYPSEDDAQHETEG